MKAKRTQEGAKYFFTDDLDLDGLALNIIDNMKHAEITSNMSMGEKLWASAYEYVRKNINEDGMMIFDRPTHITHNENEYDRVIHWLTQAINAILKTIKVKETRLEFNPVDEKSNGKGLTRYKTAGGGFILKGILSPTIMFLTREDYLKLDEMVKKELGLHLNELNCQQFYQLQNDLAENKRETLKDFPSIKSGFLPDDYGKENKKVVEQKKLFTQLLRHKRPEKKVIDNSTSTMSVFDGI